MDKPSQPKNLRTAVADTPEEILAIQHQIWMKNPIEKRLELTLFFMDSCRQLNMDGIKISHIDWSESDIKREYFRMIYKNIFPDNELKKVIDALVK